MSQTKSQQLPQNTQRSTPFSHGGFQSMTGFSAIREEIIDKNGALFKLGTNTPQYQLKQEVYVPRSEALDIIKRIEQEAKNRIDQYKHFTQQLKDKYDLYETEAHTYYYKIIDEQKGKLKILIKEKTDMLSRLKYEQLEYEKSINQLNLKLSESEKQLDLFQEQNMKSQQFIAKQQDSIYELENSLKTLRVQYDELLAREPEKVEVEKLIYVEKPEDNSVDMDELQALKLRRKENKQMITFWYQQFVRDNDRAPVIEDFSKCQGLVNEYLEMNKRYTDLKLRLLRTDQYQAEADKFKPPEVIKEIIREEVIVHQPQAVAQQVSPVVQRQESIRNQPKLTDEEQARVPSRQQNFFSSEPVFNDAEKVALQNEIATLKKELEIREQRNQELQEQIKRLESMIGENISENKILEGLQKEIEHQKTLLKDRDSKIDQLIQQENLINEQKKEILSDLQKITQSNTKLQQKNTELQHQLELYSAKPMNDDNVSHSIPDMSKYLNKSPQETVRTESKVDNSANKQLEQAQQLLLQDLARIRRENEDLQNQIEILKKVAPGDVTIIEKRVEVPVEKIVEKIVHVQVPASDVSQVQQISQRTDINNSKLIDNSLVDNLKNENQLKEQQIKDLTNQISQLKNGQQPTIQNQVQPVVADSKSDNKSQEQIQQLQQSVEQFQEKLLKKKQKIAQYKEIKANLEAELASIKLQKDQEINKVKSEYESQIQQHELEIQNLKRDQQKLINGGQSSMQTLQAQHDQQIQELMNQNQQEIAKREEQINQLRVQLDKLQTHNNKLEDQVKTLEFNLEEKTKNEVKLVDKIGSLSLLAGEAAGLKSEVDSLTVELAETKDKMSALEEKFKEEVKRRKALHNELEDSKGQIRLYCRVRPLTKSELEREESKTSAITIHDDMNLSIQGRNGIKNYTFDAVFGPKSTQDMVFEDSKRLVQSAVDGFNVCIFAYGQTGSGKTFTIQGNAQNPGLTPRTIEELFAIVETMGNFNIQLRCYMVELYKDELRDLLLPKNAPKKPLEIKESGTGQVIINGVTEVELKSTDDANRIFNYGIEHRMTRQTKMNEASSRSHLVYSIVIDATNLQTKIRTVGKLSFVDLAGSESQKKTGTSKEGAEEAKAINMSLSALGNVIEALSKGKQHVPYRDHTLTKVMKDSLGGTAKTLMFVNVSPSIYNQSESINSMDYASRVKKIKNQVKINVESKETSNLKKMVQTLEQALDAYKEALLKSNMAGEVDVLQKMFASLMGQEDDLEEGSKQPLQEYQDDIEGQHEEH